MTLKQLAKEVQEYVKDDMTNLIIWKKGRSWNYKIIRSDEYTKLSQKESEEYKEYKALIESIKAVDENYIYTYAYFANDSQNYIAFQIKRIYEGYKTQNKEELTEEEISTEIDESVDIEMKLTDEEAVFLSTFAANHYENSPENLGTKKPLFLVQSQTKRIVDTDIEEPDEVKFVVDDWFCENEFDTLEDIVREHYENKKCPIGIVSFDDAYSTDWFTDINGEEVCIVDESDYLKAYGIETDVREVGYRYDWETKAYFLIREEAKRYIKYQRHNLKNPRIYAVGCGYGNKGEYECFYDLLMRLGKLINAKDNERKSYLSKQGQAMRVLEM